MQVKISIRFILLLLCSVTIFMVLYTLDVKSTYHTFETKQLKPGLKYILRWKSPITIRPLGIGQQGFIDRNCSYTNCYVTHNRDLLKDYTDFDVIVFDGPQVNNYKQYQLPLKRSPHQKYVFASLESAANYPIYKNYFNDFFNWTWTYKLDSDLIWGYITIKDIQGNTIGPGEISWMKNEEMLPVSDDLKDVLQRKSKAVAWLVSNCHTVSKREDYAAKLNEELQKYNVSVDIYGSCSKLMCEDCDAMIKRDYYFYLAFENSFSEDYVTEKLSRALECNAVPVVFGGADYNRFLPNGSYLNARELDASKMAARMNELMNDFEQYTNYFRWTNHYRYYRREDYCDMCAMVNDDERMNNVSMYKNFTKWWNEGICIRANNVYIVMLVFTANLLT